MEISDGAYTKDWKKKIVQKIGVWIKRNPLMNDFKAFQSRIRGFSFLFFYSPSCVSLSPFNLFRLWFICVPFSIWVSLFRIFLTDLSRVRVFGNSYPFHVFYSVVSNFGRLNWELRIRLMTKQSYIAIRERKSWIKLGVRMEATVGISFLRECFDGTYTGIIRRKFISLPTEIIGSGNVEL